MTKHRITKGLYRMLIWLSEQHSMSAADVAQSICLDMTHLQHSLLNDSPSTHQTPLPGTKEDQSVSATHCRSRARQTYSLHHLIKVPLHVLSSAILALLGASKSESSISGPPIKSHVWVSLLKFTSKVIICFHVEGFITVRTCCKQRYVQVLHRLRKRIFCIKLTGPPTYHFIRLLARRCIETEPVDDTGPHSLTVSTLGLCAHQYRFWDQP